MRNKTLLLSLALFAIFSKASAQYEKGDLTLNAGFSFGLIGYGYGYYGSASGFVPLSANLEYSVNEKFAVGPYLGFFSRSYGNGDFRFTSLSFGGRGTWHASSFLNENLGMNLSEKVDIYAALLLGVETLSWKYKNETLAGYYSNNTRVILGPTIGVRYYFSPKFGAFFEAGRGAFGFGTLGISAKF
jgi:hypothetical protein